MRSTYLAIFGGDVKTMESFKEILAEKITPEEQAELERIGEVMWRDPKLLTQDDLDKTYREYGKDRLKYFFEKKLKPYVSKKLDQHSDKEDIAWSIDDIMTSDDFCATLDPNEIIPFKQRLKLSLLPEGILLPNGTWSKDDLENVLKTFRQEYLYVFFSIDF